MIGALIVRVSVCIWACAVGRDPILAWCFRGISCAVSHGALRILPEFAWDVWMPPLKGPGGL